MHNQDISRRRFLIGLAAAAACIPKISRAGAPQEEGVIPILMFHKVRDQSRSPESISPEQLARLFGFIWKQGFAPVNMSDVLLGRVDAALSEGRKALGITVDDAHPSVIHTRKGHPDAATSRSFVRIFADAAGQAGLAPRGTFFLSGPDYFGGEPGLGLDRVLDNLAPMPGLECGYHTREHRSMKGWNYQRTRQTLEDQMEDFAARGVIERIPRILAYPYGALPSRDGLRALEDLGFLGAVLASGPSPVCRYSPEGLRSSRFHIPRVNIGAYRRVTRNSTAPIDPLEGFRKDVGRRRYPVAGKAAASRSSDPESAGRQALAK
jgi:hypothetical protein